MKLEKGMIVRSALKPGNLYRVLQAGPKRLKLVAVNSAGYYSCYCKPSDVLPHSAP